MSCLSNWTISEDKDSSCTSFRSVQINGLTKRCVMVPLFLSPWNLLVVCIQQYTKHWTEYSKLLVSLTLPSLIPTLPLLPPYSPLCMKFKDPLFKLQWLPITFVEGDFFLTLGNEAQTSCHGPESSVDWILPYVSYVALTIHPLIPPTRTWTPGRQEFCLWRWIYSSCPVPVPGAR